MPLFTQRALANLALLLPLMASASDSALLRERTPSERPALLVIGVQHFANYGRDVVNSEVPDVLDSTRQREIAELAEALRRFRPTKIAVEWSHAKQDKLDARYAGYRARTVQLGASETDQLGLRIAALENLPRVWAVDWNRMPPGQVADFDYIAWAEANGASARLAAIRDPGKARLDSRRMRQQTVAEWVAHDNKAASLQESHRRYFDYTMLGNDDASPGSNWVANWYGRNLRIFANLVRLADKPGDRVLVVYGLGHAYLLKQFARESGAFEVMDADSFLRPRSP